MSSESPEPESPDPEPSAESSPLEVEGVPMSVTSAWTVVLSGSSTVTSVPFLDQVLELHVEVDADDPLGAGPGEDAAAQGGAGRGLHVGDAPCAVGDHGVPAATVPVSSRFRSSCHSLTASAVAELYVSSTVKPV